MPTDYIRTCSVAIFAMVIVHLPLCQASPKGEGVSSSPANPGETKSGPPTDGVSSSPEKSGKKGRLDYEHALPFPLPSIDCDPGQQVGSECKRPSPQKGDGSSKP